MTLPTADIEGLVVGARVQLDSGQEATVVAISDAGVTVDANHDLAGQSLTFDLELTKLRVQRTVSLSGHSLAKMDLNTIIVRFRRQWPSRSISSMIVLFCGCICFRSGEFLRCLRALAASRPQDASESLSDIAKDVCFSRGTVRAG